MMMLYDAPTIPPSQQVEYALLHDARAVHDTALLRFQIYKVDGVLFWVLGEVTPGPNSGSITIPGAFINAETGEFVTPRDPELVMVKEGMWKVLTTAVQDRQKAEASYSWSEPLNQERRVLVPEDFYSPFTHGGKILFLPTPGESGIEQFGPVHLIFPDWERYIAPASVFIEQHRGLFAEDEARVDNVANLIKLLSSENKLIAVLAFRRLIASKSLTSVIIGKQLQAERHSSAIFSYLILTLIEPIEKNPLLQEIIHSIEAAQDIERIRAIALSAFAAGLFHSSDMVIISRCKEVLSATRRRLKELEVPVEKEHDLFLMFEKMDVLQ